MNIRRNSASLTVPLLCGVALLFLAASVRAQVTTNYFYYQGNQAGSPGTNWSGPGVTTGKYWTNTFGGTTSTPASGTTNATSTNYNIYVLTNNGVLLGSGTATTLIRNPYTTVTNTVVTFPGDSLILQTNTQLRFKNGNTTGTYVTGVPYAFPTNVFPGNFGQPGLVLDGGCVNNGTSAVADVIAGTMYSVPGTVSYLNPGDTFAGDSVLRGLIFLSQFSGSGTVAILNGSNICPVLFSATNNTFSGTWVVKNGCLRGVGDGTADGYVSLGTNNSVVYDIDPQFAVNTSTFNGNSVFINGPAVLDMGTNLVNCGGSLILSNGGTIYLHGNVIFSSVNLEGTMLANGTYTLSQLQALAPQSNFSPAGSLFTAPFGTLTIQPPGLPVIAALVAGQPQPSILYTNATATFSAVAGGTAPFTYLWQKNEAPLSNGGNISGATNATLTVSAVSASDAATYTVAISNAIGGAVSAPASLTIVSPVEPFEQAVANLSPVAFYQFNETANPATNNTEAFDYAGGLNGTYGAAVQNGYTGTVGPNSGSGFPGFNSTNLSAHFSTAAGNDVKTAPWNISGNSATFAAWLNPDGVQNVAASIAICRGNGVVAGLVYYGAVTNGVVPLGYVWDNEPETYNWNSGLVPPSGQWSFVALTVSPSSATIYLFTNGGFTASTHVYPHVVQTFNTNGFIGEDYFSDGGNGARSFLGYIDDVAVFNSALSSDQLAGLFYAATGVTNYAPSIGVPPASQTAFTGQQVQFYVGADGSDPLTYQWASGVTASGGPYTPLTDGGGISGSSTATLTIQSVSLGQAMDYVCTVGNTAGSATSPPATLTVFAAQAPIFNITNTVQQAAGADWNTTGMWIDGQGGQSAAEDAVEFPGSIFEIAPGARLRSPAAATAAVFPGVELLLDGAGFINNPGAGTTQGELRFKQPQVADGAYGSVTFPNLVFNGGQLDLGNDGIQPIYGLITVLSNGIFYSDSANDRGYLINAQVVGTNSIYYYGDAVAYPETYTNSVTLAGTNSIMTGGYTNDLDFANAGNTFSGPWYVEAGLLLGSVSNTLGTNSITVFSNGLFQTLYDLNDSGANLVVQGKMLLTADDTFASVILGNFSLPTGTYTAAQLCSNYPNFFPASWVPHLGAPTQTNAAGSLTVLVNSGATIIQNPQPAAVEIYPTQSAQFTAIGGGQSPIGYQWQLNGAKLTDGTNLVTGFIVNGSQTGTLSLYNVPATEGGNYTIVVTNSFSSVTSAPAVLTFFPTFPAINVTLQTLEAAGLDWNSLTNWDNGLAASTTALQYPGSTFEVPAGTLLRTPVAAIPFTNFPGIQLTVDGSGVFNNNGGNVAGTAQGEIRFKEGQSGETNYFPLLIMAGGQLDTGVNGVTEIAGNMDVISNTPIYIDSAAGAGNPRQYQIDAYLEGNGSIEYHDFDATLSGGLYITGSTNSYTGTWNVVQGPLIGGGINSLGTNNIVIGANGVLETMYDLNSPNGLLTVNGRVFLHQNDTVGQMQVGSVGLNAGVYTYAQLNAAFPAAFPLTWNSVFGSTSNSAAGSITVLNSLILPPTFASQPPPNAAEFTGANVTYSVTTGGNPGTYQWYANGTLINGATGSSYTFVTAAGANNYYCVVSNSAGVITNLVDTNTATTPPIPVTLADTANWTLQGTGTIPANDGTTLTLTDNNLNESASAFYDIAQYIEGFNASFTYLPSGLLAADGVTFCVQNAAAGPAALGSGGGNLGYFGISNSAAFEINIYANATGGPGIGVGTNGQIANPYGSVTNAGQTAPLLLNSGDPINVNLYYMDGVLQAILTDATTGTTFVTNYAMGDIGALVGDSVGYIGFTGADGGSASIQQISNFIFTPAASPVLTMSKAGAGTFDLSWSGGTITNLLLQQSSSLVGPWANVSGATNVVGSAFQVQVTPGVNAQFYRLGLQ